MEEHAGEVTRLLADANAGQGQARTRLFELMYSELHRLAASYMRKERPDHTLQATALVNEAYLKLFQRESLDVRNRKHMLCLMAQAMRRILVDHARLQKAQKRGDGRRKLSLEEALSIPAEYPLQVLALNEAIEQLSRLSPRQAQVVELHVLTGLTHDEIAELMGVSLKTIKRDWRFATSWLQHQMQRSEQHDTGALSAD